MDVNRSTSFLGPAYAMLEIFLVAAVFALLLLIRDLSPLTTARARLQGPVPTP
jgi:hypothetical protein